MARQARLRSTLLDAAHLHANATQRQAVGVISGGFCVCASPYFVAKDGCINPFRAPPLPLSLPHIIGSPSAHCGSSVSSSPHRTLLLSVTESVVLPPDSGVHHMPQAYRSEPSLLPIERPRC